MRESGSEFIFTEKKGVFLKLKTHFHYIDVCTTHITREPHDFSMTSRKKAAEIQEGKI